MSSYSSVYYNKISKPLFCQYFVYSVSRTVTTQVTMIKDYLIKIDMNTLGILLLIILYITIKFLSPCFVNISYILSVGQ